VQAICDERLCRLYKTRTVLYILEDLICDGHVECFSRRCDRSCHFFWHPQWLEALQYTR
jgi:hypothetical protein